MKEIMDASSMKRSLVRMAHEIVEKNKGVEGLVLVGIKTRGEFLATRLKQMIDQFEECDIPCDSLDISAWRDDVERSEVQQTLTVAVQVRMVCPSISIRHCLFVVGLRKVFSIGAGTSSIKIHPNQVFSAVEALEQIALQMPAINGFLDHFLLLIVPHWIVQHILQHTQRPQFSGTHMAQIGAVVAAVGAPVFLLPTGVAGSSVNQLVQSGRVLYSIVHGAIVLEAAIIFPGCLAADDTLRAQILNIIHREKRSFITFGF